MKSENASQIFFQIGLRYRIQRHNKSKDIINYVPLSLFGIFLSRLEAVCTRDYYFPPRGSLRAATRIFVALFGDPKYGIWTHGVPHVCALMDGLIHKHFIWINHRLVHSWPSNCNTPSSRPVPNNLKTHKYLPSMCTKIWLSMVFIHFKFFLCETTRTLHVLKFQKYS